MDEYRSWLILFLQKIKVDYNTSTNLNTVKKKCVVTQWNWNNVVIKKTA